VRIGYRFGQSPGPLEALTRSCRGWVLYWEIIHVPDPKNRSTLSRLVKVVAHEIPLSISTVLVLSVRYSELFSYRYVVYQTLDLVYTNTSFLADRVHNSVDWVPVPVGQYHNRRKARAALFSCYFCNIYYFPYWYSTAPFLSFWFETNDFLHTVAWCRCMNDAVQAHDITKSRTETRKSAMVAKRFLVERDYSSAKIRD
jgi:hypothetical protein